MSFWLILILIFCLISAISAFKEYKKIIKNKFWVYAWTGHALVLGIIAVLLRILNLDVAVLDLLAGTTLLISGYGAIILGLFSFIEKNSLLFSIKTLLFAGSYHFIMAVLGIWLLFTTYPTYFNVLITIVILLFYAGIMIPKGLDVPWILYKKSSISLKTRKIFLTATTIFLFILLPILSLLV
jgi:hypothetical protein